MSFTCPECDRQALKITHSLELPPDADWDEITLQVIHCEACKFSGLAVYRESRRGRLDDEIVQHSGYRVSAPAVRSLRRAIRNCPRPRDLHCNCETHRRFAPQDPDDLVWAEIRTVTSFPIV